MCTEELRKFYFMLNIIVNTGVTKLSVIRQVDHIAQIGKMKMYWELKYENLNGRDHMET
jgi:hypothetical protein